MPVPVGGGVAGLGLDVPVSLVEKEGVEGGGRAPKVNPAPRGVGGCPPALRAER